MKHLQIFEKFMMNEAVIMPETLNNTGIPRDLRFQDLVKYGEQNGFDVVNYQGFYDSLDEQERKTAPPEYDPVPFFALFNPVTNRPMFVLKNQGMVLPRFLVEDIMSHEFVHRGQSSRRTRTRYTLPDPMNRATYFSNKDEVMAFAYTIAINLHRNTSTFDQAVKKLSTNRIPMEIGRLWDDIVRNVDDKTLNRYRKNIYSYLENLYGVNQD